MKNVLEKKYPVIRLKITKKIYAIGPLKYERSSFEYMYLILCILTFIPG